MTNQRRPFGRGERGRDDDVKGQLSRHAINRTESAFNLLYSRRRYEQVIMQVIDHLEFVGISTLPAKPVTPPPRAPDRARPTNPTT